MTRTIVSVLLSLPQISHLSSVLISKNKILIQSNWSLNDHETSFIIPERFNEVSNRCFNDQERFFNGLNISFTAPDTYTKDSMRLFIYLYLSFTCRDRLYNLSEWLNNSIGGNTNHDGSLMNVSK